MSALSLHVLSILAPGFLLALIGLLWARRGVDFPVGFVTTLVLNLGLPALLFHTLATAAVPLRSVATFALAALAVHVVFGTVAVSLLRVSGRDWRLAVAHTVGNTGNLGLPLCLLAFGEEGLAYAMTFFAVQCLLMFTLGEAVYAGSASPARALRSPVLHAVWLGVLARVIDVPIPTFALDTLALLGQFVIPLMLITLGVSLAGMRARALPTTLAWAAVRTACALSIGIGLSSVLGLEGVARGVLVIQAAMPVAVFNFLLAERHGRDSREVSGLILVTHLGAVFYLPPLLGWVLAR